MWPIHSRKGFLWHVIHEKLEMAENRPSELLEIHYFSKKRLLGCLFDARKGLLKNSYKKISEILLNLAQAKIGKISGFFVKSYDINFLGHQISIRSSLG